jgi:hypothetical protein
MGCAAVAETSAKAVPTMASSPIDAAKSKLSEASKAGCAWRDTKKMIKKAEALKAAGKIDKANALAAKATMQSENGLKQCASEAKRLQAS